MIELILLESVDNLGRLGDRVQVKPGYARNFLLPRGKALRATKDNLAYFDAQKAQLEAENQKKKDAAQAQAKTLEGFVGTVIRQSSESGKLYGSVTARDVALSLEAAGHSVSRQHIDLGSAIKDLGIYSATVKLHPDVSVEVKLNIARSEDEAAMQLEKGHALVGTQADQFASQADTSADEDTKASESNEDKTADDAEIAETEQAA